MQHEKPNDPIRIAEVTRRFKERYGWYIRMRLLRKERQEDPEPRRKVNPHARTACGFIGCFLPGLPGRCRDVHEPTSLPKRLMGTGKISIQGLQGHCRGGIGFL